MSNPSVLFVTDDRESYASGNYYLAYQRAFERRFATTLHHPLDPLPSLHGFDLVVLGHSAIENYARMRGKRFLPSRLRNRLWFRHGSLRSLRRTRLPLVVFTKNDYKHFDVKNAFIEFVQPDLVITHTRRALETLVTPRPGTQEWLPFGVDLQLFRPSEPPGGHAFDVGFRANANSSYNEGERERFYRALTRLEGARPVSLTMSTHGQGFLVGQPYVDWLGSCALLGNTVSAAGTVGPRFLEAIACGAVPLAPRNPYEGLLVADQHYVPVEAGADARYPDLEGQVARFFDDADYREQLRTAGRELAEIHSVERHVVHVCRSIGV